MGAIGTTRLHQPGVQMVMAAHFALPALCWLVVHAPRTRFVAIVRACYPLLLLPGLYSAIDVMNRFGAAPVHDALIQRWEEAIFGMQPSRDWWRRHPSELASAVFHAAYLGYYVVIAAPVIVFVAQRRTDVLDRYLAVVIATYLGCYLVYLLFPVAGPYYEFARPTGAFIANLPARLVYRTLSSGSAFGAAFPSSHVAGTVAATLASFRASRMLGGVLAIPTLLIAVGVVYCQMHYAIDSAAGVATGVAIATLFAWRGWR